MSQNRSAHIVQPDTDTDTSALLVLVAARDEAAFRRLHRAWAQRLHHAVLRILIDPAQTEEVVQEIFLEVWLRADRFHPGRGSAAGFLLRLAKARAIDRVRASQSLRDRTLLQGRYDYEAGTSTLARIHDDWAAAHDLHQLVALLTPLQQEVLNLVYFQDFTHHEVAAQLRVPVGTVKSRVFSAIAGLRRSVEACQ